MSAVIIFKCASTTKALKKVILQPVLREQVPPAEKRTKIKYSKYIFRLKNTVKKLYYV